MENSISDMINAAISQTPWVHNTVTSIVVFLIFIFLRTMAVHFIKRKSEILDKDQWRWINRTNNATTIFIFIGFVLIWAPQLQTFALSLTAVAVAIVLITKELLMCLTGGLLRASSRPFDVGDWITVDGLSGEVKRITATMTLLEKLDMSQAVYDHTGETIQIPNSRFLTANVENLNFTKKYIYHSFNITTQFADINPQDVKGYLTAILEENVAPYMKDATQFNRMIERKIGVDFADIQPSVAIRTTDLGHYKFNVRIFVPTPKASKIEDDVTTRFLQYCYDARRANSTDGKAG